MAAVKQLVVRSAPRSGQRRVEAVERGYLAAPPLGEWDYTPVFGTPDLIGLAFALRDSGYTIVGTGLVDRDFVPDQSDEGTDLERIFATALQKKDTQLVSELLDGAIRGLRLGFIRFMGPERERFTISRDGSIRVQAGTNERPLLKILSEFLTENG